MLNSLFGVDCKYILLDKGKDITNHLEKLYYHFVNQNTPVMIGGGVLAFTCVGMQWNQKTGECKLLILVYMFIPDVKDRILTMLERVTRRNW